MESGGKSLPISATTTNKPKPGAGRGDPFTEESGLNRFVVELMAKWHIPGLAVAVHDGDDTWAKVPRVLHLKPFVRLPASCSLTTTFRASAMPPSVPVAVTPDTVFYAGSTTKPFTAAAVAQLIEDSGGSGIRTRTESARAFGWPTPLADVLLDDA